MFKAVLLDIDGTLIDSNEAHAKAWMDVFSEFKIPASYEDVRWKIGMGGDQLLPAVTDIQEDTSLGQKISQRRGEIFRDRYLPHLKAFPGARDLLRKMRRDGYVLVVATSASEEDLEGLLKQVAFEELLPVRTQKEDAERSKPSPDIIQAALKKAGVAAENSVMIGDTPYDVMAAKKAGVKSISFTCGGWGSHELHGSVAIYEGPWDLFNHFDQSVLFVPKQEEAAP